MQRRVSDAPRASYDDVTLIHELFSMETQTVWQEGASGSRNRCCLKKQNKKKPKLKYKKAAVVKMWMSPALGSAGRLRQETVSSTRLPTGDQSLTTWSAGAETAEEERMGVAETQCLFSHMEMLDYNSSKSGNVTWLSLRSKLIKCSIIK